MELNWTPSLPLSKVRWRMQLRSSAVPGINDILQRKDSTGWKMGDSHVSMTTLKNLRPHVEKLD